MLGPFSTPFTDASVDASNALFAAIPGAGGADPLLAAAQFQQGIQLTGFLDDIFAPGGPGIVGLVPEGFLPPGIAFANDPLVQSTQDAINQAIINSLPGLGNFIETGDFSGFTGLQTALDSGILGSGTGFSDPNLNFGTNFLLNSGIDPSFQPQLASSILSSSGLDQIGITLDSIGLA